MPTGRSWAAAASETVTPVPDPPGASVPSVGVAFNQTDVLIKAQVSALEPALVSEKDAVVTENGPPTSPLEVKPVAGAMRRSSGRSNASATPAVVKLAGAVALNPRPRLAKPRQ